MNFQEMDIDRLEMTANMLKAMAHPMRIAILKHLEDGKKTYGYRNTRIARD